MTINKYFFIPILLFTFFAEAKSFQQEEVLFTVEDRKVTSEEFTFEYKKNNINNEEAYTKKDVDNYLNLFINFKLKVHEAFQRKMDTISLLNREFNSYKNQLKKPYLSNDEFNQSMIEEAWERYQKEVRASHILIRVDEHADPIDTLKAWETIHSIYQKALQENDFNDLAMRYSQDPSVKINQGDLGYFTSMQMVYPFESAAFHTPVGGISKPFRTNFGYHIIKVNDVRPARGKIEVSHIMARINNPSDSLVQQQAKNKIFEIAERLEAGYDWDEVCKLYSEDFGTRNKGGRLPAFTVGTMPPTFVEASFALSAQGQISDPFETPFGWHIVRLEKVYGLGTYNEMKPVIASRIERDQRSELSERALIKKLIRENGFEEHPSASKEAEKFVSDYLPGRMEGIHNVGGNIALFTIGTEVYGLKQFKSFIDQEWKKRANREDRNWDVLYSDFKEFSIIKYEEGKLSEKYPEYKLLLQEYREGILLFEIMNSEVWSKASSDSIGLKAYYNQNRDKYIWNERAEMDIFSSEDADLIKKIEEYIKNNPKSTKERVDSVFNGEGNVSLQIENKKVEKEDEDYFKKIPFEKGIYLIEIADKYVLVRINDILSKDRKKLEEIKGKVIADYQAYLDLKFIEELKNKYTVQINKKALKNVQKDLSH
ncbi:MAG: peptidylprolyl isomerase [Cyclobacteriaceae bacterium]|nr:peptidylprolyl isomerase [Cyclobacteriaceae bacterium]